jgi:hypothetical protein
MSLSLEHGERSMDITFETFKMVSGVFLVQLATRLTEKYKFFVVLQLKWLKIVCWCFTKHFSERIFCFSLQIAAIIDVTLSSFVIVQTSLFATKSPLGSAVAFYLIHFLFH